MSLRKGVWGGGEAEPPAPGDAAAPGMLQSRPCRSHILTRQVGLGWWRAAWRAARLRSRRCLNRVGATARHRHTRGRASGCHPAQLRQEEARPADAAFKSCQVLFLKCKIRVSAGDAAGLPPSMGVRPATSPGQPPVLLRVPTAPSQCLLLFGRFGQNPSLECTVWGRPSKGSTPVPGGSTAL